MVTQLQTRVGSISELAKWLHSCRQGSAVSVCWRSGYTVADKGRQYQCVGEVVTQLQTRVGSISELAKWLHSCRQGSAVSVCWRSGYTAADKGRQYQCVGEEDRVTGRPAEVTILIDYHFVVSRSAAVSHNRSDKDGMLITWPSTLL